MHKYDQLYIGIYLKCFFQCCGIHIPGVTLRVDEYSLPIFIRHTVYGSIECHIRTEYPASPERPFMGTGLTVQLLACQLYCKMKCRCTAGKADCILAADMFCHQFFTFIDILPRCGYPVLVKCILHPSELIAVHGG